MKITRIEPSKHKKDRILVFFEGDSLLKVTEAELLHFALQAGQDVSPETLTELKTAGERSTWKATGAAMTGRRMLSRKEVKERLIKKGAEENEAEETAAWLTSIGAVDDAVYAGVIVRHYAALGYGPGRIRQEFVKRGIAKELWDDALAQLGDPTESIERCIAAKMQSGDEKERKKIANALLRRGFSWNDIRPILNRWGEEIEEEV